MKPRSLKAYGRYGTVGLELVLSMVVGYLLGRWGDSKLGTTWLSWLGAAVGVYAGFRSMFKAAKAMTREAEEADRERDQQEKE